MLGRYGEGSGCTLKSSLTGGISIFISNTRNVANIVPAGMVCLREGVGLTGWDVVLRWVWPFRCFFFESNVGICSAVFFLSFMA